MLMPTMPHLATEHNTNISITIKRTPMFMLKNAYGDAYVGSSPLACIKTTLCLRLRGKLKQWKIPMMITLHLNHEADTYLSKINRSFNCASTDECFVTSACFCWSSAASPPISDGLVTCTKSIISYQMDRGTCESKNC